MQIYECIDPTGADGVPKFKNSIKSIESFCSNAILDAETKTHLRFVFAQFHDLVEEDRSTFEQNGYTRTKTFSPIELVGVCCLLSQKGAERPIGMLRGDILAMRAFLREVHLDLRMNKTCWQTIWRFIDRLEYYRGAVSGTTVRKAPTKAIKRKSRPRPQAQAGAIVEDEPVLSGNSKQATRLGNASQRPPTANMTRPNPRSKPAAGPRITDQNAASTSFISQLSAAASLDRVSDRDLNATLDTTRTIASASSTPLIPSPTSTESTAGQRHGSVLAPRKRVALDLGSSTSGNKELEFKKARLMAGYVKEEKDA